MENFIILNVGYTHLREEINALSRHRDFFPSKCVSVALLKSQITVRNYFIFI